MRNFFQLIVAILILATLVWLGWQGYLLLHKEQSGLDSRTQSLLIIISVLVIICTFILSSAIRSTAGEISRGRQLQNKIVLYENFLMLWQAKQTNNIPANENQVNQDLAAIKSSIALLSNSKVIKAANELFATDQLKGNNSGAVEEARDNLLLEMRADLGNGYVFYLKKEFKKLFIN
jgi:hypothetical protein